jgi:hypothetical protein
LKDNKIKLSYEYGKKAFNNGLKCVPAWDKEFLETIIEGLKNGEGIPYTKAWLKGWHEANLKQEVY